MTEERLQALELRLQRIEDERAIERLIASYGPRVDAGDAEPTAELWASEGSYDVENWMMQGRNAIAAMVRSPQHRGLIERGCAHFLGPAVVSVDGDDAVAVCESTLLLKDGAKYRVERAGANYFHLRRAAQAPGGWQIVNRVTRQLDGTDLARSLLIDGLEGRIR